MGKKYPLCHYLQYWNNDPKMCGHSVMSNPSFYDTQAHCYKIFLLCLFNSWNSYQTTGTGLL